MSRLPLWLVISGLGITQIIGWGTTYYALGALSQDIAATTGWSSPKWASVRPSSATRTASPAWC